MANAYTQIYIHLVFSPKNRQCLVAKTYLYHERAKINCQNINFDGFPIY